MGFNLLLNYRPFLPWICSSLAIGYAAYLHWRLRRLKEEDKKLVINPDPENLARRHVVNIDDIDRGAYRKKRVSYCRCWKSTTFPLCDGIHKCHNQENNDSVGALVLTWNEPEPEPEPKTLDSSSLDASIISEQDPDMDIKSIDSESPILQSSNGESNGEFEQMEQIGGDNNHNNSSDEHISLEMIEENFESQKKEEEDDFDEDTVKVEP